MFPSDCQVCRQTQENCKCRQFQPPQGAVSIQPQGVVSTQRPQPVSCPFCGKDVTGQAQEYSINGSGIVDGWKYGAVDSCCGEFCIFNTELPVWATFKQEVTRQLYNPALLSAMVQSAYCPQCSGSQRLYVLERDRLWFYFCARGHLPVLPFNKVIALSPQIRPLIWSSTFSPTVIPLSTPLPSLAGAAAMGAYLFGFQQFPSVASAAAMGAPLFWPWFPGGAPFSAAVMAAPLPEPQLPSVAPLGAAVMTAFSVANPSPIAAGAASAASSEIARRIMTHWDAKKCGICSEDIPSVNQGKRIQSTHAITLFGSYYICMECAKTCPTCLQTLSPGVRFRYIELDFLAPSFYRVCMPCGSSYHYKQPYINKIQTTINWLVNRFWLFKESLRHDKQSYLFEKQIVSSEPCEACAQEKTGSLPILLARHTCPNLAWKKAGNHKSPSSNAGGASSEASSPLAVAGAAARAASPAAGAASAASSEIAHRIMTHLDAKKCGICSEDIPPGNQRVQIVNTRAITLYGSYYICMECAKTCPTCLQTLSPGVKDICIELEFLAPSFYRVCIPCGSSYQRKKSPVNDIQTAVKWLVTRFWQFKESLKHDKHSYLLKKEIVSSEQCKACAQEQLGSVPKFPAIHTCRDRAWQEASNHKSPSSNAGGASNGASSPSAIAGAAARAASPVATLSPTAAGAASAASFQIVNQPLTLREEKCRVCCKDMGANQNSEWKWGGYIEIRFMDPSIWEVCNVCKFDFDDSNTQIAFGSRLPISEQKKSWNEWVTRRKRFAEKTASLRLPWNPTGLKCEGCFMDIPPGNMRNVPPSKQALHGAKSPYDEDDFNNNLPYRLCETCNSSWYEFRRNNLNSLITLSDFLVWLNKRNEEFEPAPRVPYRQGELFKRKKLTPG